MNDLSLVKDYDAELIKTFEQINNCLEEGRFTEAASLLSELHYADLADFLDNTNHRSYYIILPLIKDNIKPETLVWISDANKQTLIEALSATTAASLLEQLDLEDTIEVIERLDEELKQEVISLFSSDKQQQIIEGFNYPENTAGRIIEKNFITVQESWNAKYALEFIKNARLEHEFHAAIVINYRMRPVGSIALSTIIKNMSDDILIGDIMQQDIKIIEAFTPLDEIAFLFKQYALTIVPVVNKAGKLIGCISIDNMVYVIEQQAEKDIMQFSGLHAPDTFYNIFHTAKYRFPWLFVNLITACLTAVIINKFSDTIAQIITISAIMHIVAAMGGNAGTQAMTVTVRALANRDIHTANILKVILKEILVCTINGVILAMIAGGVSLVMLTNVDLSLVFLISIIINFVVAGFFGSVVPITLDHFNIDPATASGVFLTTLTDALGLLTFLTLSYIFLV